METNGNRKPLLIACDFDGTITLDDTLVRILDLYGSPRWREVQDKVVSGELTIREGLRQEMGSVQADLHQVTELLKTAIRLDPGFPAFLKEMRALGVPVIVLSGGFDLCVETVLEKHALWPVPFLANRLVRADGAWQVEYPYPSENCDACGHCKGDPIREWNRKGYSTVFVGNGVTDRCGALHAELTFAKDELADWCGAKNLPVAPFGTFHDIREELKKRALI